MNTAITTAQRYAWLFGLTATLGLSHLLDAATILVSSSAPPINDADIANDNGSSDAGGDQGHVWSDRPHQGQSFITGPNPTGYELKAVTMKNRNNTVGSSPVFNIIVGTITANGSPETVTPIGTTETGIAPSYSPGQYLTFIFDTPLILDPTTNYAFLWGSAGQGFVSANNLSDSTYPDGTALSSGDDNMADLSNVILRNVDRVFHLDMEAIVPAGAAVVSNEVATAISAHSAQLNGRVLDIGDAAPTITIRWGDEDGGGDPNGWDEEEVLPGTQGVGPFSATTSISLAPATTYFYRAFATNSTGLSSASPSLQFTTLPSPPTVRNLAGTDIEATSATVGGEIIDTGGQNPTLFIYWGTSDGGTNAALWANTTVLGIQNGTATAALSGLTSGTTYFYRAFANNTGGSGWALTTTNFSTKVPLPPTVDNRSANGISGTAANLRGEVTDTGFESPVVLIHYGDNDGGTNPGNWDHAVNLGVRNGDFSLFVTGLAPLTNYFYRAQATNGAGSTWAPSTAAFSTTDLIVESIVINEIHYDHEPKTERGEFIELFNPSDADVNISGWRLSNGIDFVFPSTTTIPANGFIVVAEDPITVSNVFGVSSLGPYFGRLSNEGERIELEDASGTTIDEVDYGIGFPWPSASRGGGSSMELMNAGLDNDLGSSWRSSQADFSGSEVTHIGAGETWSYRKGISEASSPIENWRQQGFNQDTSWLNGAAVIGYGDGDDTTLLGDMQSNYVSVFLRKEFTLSGAIPNELLVRVYYDDGAIVWINGQEVARLNVDSGDITHEGIRASDPPGGSPGAAVSTHPAGWVDVPITDAGNFLVGGVNTIAIHAFNDDLNSSGFSIDCELKTPPPTTSSTDDPTPLAANTVFNPNAPPNIRQVNHTPQQPIAGEAVAITAKVTDPQGIASVVLSYQVVDPGAYIHKEDAAYETNWIDLVMVDDGTGGDQGVGDAIFTVTLPGSLQTHRRLVRYRITVTDTQGASVQTPFDDDESPNFAYFCYNGVPDWTGSKQPGSAPDITYPAAALDSVAVYHLISKESDVVLCQWTGPTDGLYRYFGTIVYDGQVYDHMKYRIRGNASTRQVGRNKWKFNFNRAHPFEARDNYGQKYDIPWDKINVLPGSNPWWRNNASTEGTILCESAGFRAYQIAGGLGSNTHFFHLRVIDSADEAPSDQYAGDFWGLYIAIEQPEAEFLNERGLPDGNIYNVHGNPGSSSKRNQGATQNTDFSDLTGFHALHNNTTSQAQWEASLDFESYFAFNAINLAINNSDMRPRENINYYRNSETDKWHILPWDIDLTFEDAPHLGRGDTPQWENIYHCLQYPSIGQTYENKVREILDLFLDNDQGAHLMDEFAGFITQGGIDNLVEASQAQWDYHPRKNKKGIWYGNFNTTLLTNRTFADYVQYNKDFITIGGYGRSNLAAKQTDTEIPEKPIITHSGEAGFPANQLTFTSSAFSDPQGAGTFSAMEWRIGRVRNPSTPDYLPGDRYVYELETFYQSPMITNFTTSYTFPAAAARVGDTYRARVRHIDSTGKASHWSDPIEFTAGLPDVAPYRASLVISEIMYHPASTGTAEYIEIYNLGSEPIDLTGVRFTKGIDFDFPYGTTIATGAYLLVVADLAVFEAEYGTGLPIAGVWEEGDRLSNGGENLKLSLGAGTAIHEFEYNDKAPWPPAADGMGYSLTLAFPESGVDHANPLNWRASVNVSGSPGTSDDTQLADWLSTHSLTGNDLLSDQDGDGRVALVEYGLYSDPNNADEEFIPSVDTGGARLDFLRARGADDVSVIAEFSTDLVTWLPTNVESIDSRANETDMITVRPAAGMENRSLGYFRLRVEQK